MNKITNIAKTMRNFSIKGGAKETNEGRCRVKREKGGRSRRYRKKPARCNLLAAVSHPLISGFQHELRVGHFESRAQHFSFKIS